MEHEDELLVARGDVEVRLATRHTEARDALALLDAGERRAGGPLVDEAEQQRLERFASGEAPPEGWRCVLARQGSAIVGYGALVFAPSGSGTVRGDAAVGHEHEPTEPVLRALLAGLSRLAGEQPGATRVVVWVRHVHERDHAFAEAEGFVVERRLGVLGRSLDDGRDLRSAAEVDADTSVSVRGYRPDLDDEGVVDVLAAAYHGTDEAGWDLAQFRERRDLPWFRPEDLLVAEDRDGRIDGLVWLKRRGDDVGEVYNLAIHPRAQGQRLGGHLLSRALSHLRTGCREVVLWVDLANDRAVRLYRTHGFDTLWEDVALMRPAGAPVERRR